MPGTSVAPSRAHPEFIRTAPRRGRAGIGRAPRGRLLSKPSRLALALAGFFVLDARADRGASPALTLDGLPGTLRTYSARTLGSSRIGATLALEGSADRGLLREGTVLRIAPDGTAASIRPTRVIAATSTLSLSAGLGPWLDVAAALPFHGDRVDGVPGLDATGIGDLRILGKLQYPWYPHPRVFEMAYIAIVTVPTARAGRGFWPRRSWYPPRLDGNPAVQDRNFGAGAATGAGLVAWTLDLWEMGEALPLLFDLNWGLLVSGDERSDHAFLLNASAELSPSRYASLFAEFSGESRLAHWNGGPVVGDDPARLSTGLRLRAPLGLSLALAGDFGFARRGSYHRVERKTEGAAWRYAVRPTPAWGGSAALSWSGFVRSQDDDEDGVSNGLDRCRAVPEDQDGFEDGDGCPEADDDADGIADLRDRCPREPEERDGFRDEDGCPDPDNDEDGLVDLLDRCPEIAEDGLAPRPDDGCPRRDTDADGLADAEDRCPSVAEDRDAFQDADGCPESDNDGDGFPDGKDKCPNAIETLNGHQDEDGCPDTAPPPPPPRPIEKNVTLRGVSFKSGSAELDLSSYAVLHALAEQLRARPEVRVEIRGYTDDVGNAARNRALSQARAEAVRDYLVTAGIDAARVRAVGFGPDNPVAPNTSAADRALNRRIEMYRIE